jgi:hypothetical protein
VRNSNMRKQLIGATGPNPTGTSEEWLNLEEIARVEVSSEDPQYPIESAFKYGESLGWRAGQPGEQVIRLIFDEPKDLRRIWLRFGQMAKRVLSEKSFDSNGTLIRELRPWR